MKKILFTAFTCLSLSWVTAQDITALKTWPEISSLMRIPFSDAKSELGEYGYNLVESSVTDFDMNSNIFENSNHVVEHPIMEEMSDVITLGTRNSRVMLIYYSIVPAKMDNTINYISENDDFVNSIKEAGFIEKSYKAGDYSEVTYFHNSQSNLKIRIEDFYIDSMLLGADVYIYEDDFDLSFLD